jgi:hypothetical protein
VIKKPRNGPYVPSWERKENEVYLPSDTITAIRIHKDIVTLGVLYSRWNFIALQKSIHYNTHSRKLLEHTYTSDQYGLGTLTPIEFFQQDLLWQSSNTHCHSCSHKAFKHSSGQSIVGLSVHLHTTTAPGRIHHLPAIYQPLRSDVFTVHRRAPNHVQLLLVL